jgi:hypothetical protein
MPGGARGCPGREGIEAGFEEPWVGVASREEVMTASS